MECLGHDVRRGFGRAKFFAGGVDDGSWPNRCRLGPSYRAVGHKRVHALKLQSVALPSAIIANMYGPVGVLASFEKGNC